MFKFFVYIAGILVLWLLYVSYFSNNEDKSSKVQGGGMSAVIYQKSYCPYCQKASSLLEKQGIPYKEYDLENDESLYNDLVQRTGQKTVPYIFINDKYIGGFQELLKLYQEGKL